MKYILSIILSAGALTVHAQYSNFNTQRNWSMNKKEILFGVGATQFLGDLGGASKVGKDYSLADIDFPSTGLGVMVGFRYRFHPFWATTTSLNFGLMRGDDSQTQEIIRNTRNLHFRSPVIELSQRIECIIVANEKVGRRFNISGLKGFQDHNFQLYVFTGIGVAYYNPQARYNGSWTNLRPLKTEGQGLEGGPSVYKPITATVPFGVGFRVGINRMWRIGIEATYIKTFTDYIDDVSGVYYDRNALAAQVGPDAAYLSNPATDHLDWFGKGEQRGDKQKDAYFYANLVITRNITYKSYSRNKIQRWRGVRAKF
jgi:hypothetical protein